MSDTPLQPGAFPEQQGERPFFHGGRKSVDAIDPHRLGADGELLCGSASPNVALRYGEVTTCLTVTRWTTMSLADFLANQESFEDLRAVGIGAVIVEATPQSFDFPVETLFVLDPSAVSIGKSGSVEALGLQLDELPRREPEGPCEAGWDLYVECVFGGDLTEALKSFDWEIGTHHWKVGVPADDLMREFIGLVTEDGRGGYLAEHNFCTDITLFATLAAALVHVDVARCSYLADRRMIARRLSQPALVDEVYEDEDAEMRF